MSSNEPLITLTNVNKVFSKPDGGEITILSDVNLAIQSNEFVTLLGKSGSGKSTILRIVAGLLSPSKGEVKFKNNLIKGPYEAATMIFQNFALFPWLTVAENVGLGLEARGDDKKIIRSKAITTLNLMGLEGYEDHYPTELSGGMKQRVGIARALVVEPELLLMDEPFSALDVLTAENLKNDILEIWHKQTTKLKSILLVTHNIEETVFLSDRVLILSSHPGSIVHEIKIDLPHPRDKESEDFKAIVDQIYSLLTNKPILNAEKIQDKTRIISSKKKAIPIISPIRIIAFLEILANEPYNGHADLPKLSEKIHLSFDELSLIIDTCYLLRFANLTKGDINITEEGKKFALLPNKEQRQVWGEHLKNYLSVTNKILKLLETHDHPLSYEYIYNDLKDYFDENTATTSLETILSWCRYGGLLNFNKRSKLVTQKAKNIKLSKV